MTSSVKFKVEHLTCVMSICLYICGAKFKKHLIEPLQSYHANKKVGQNKKNKLDIILVWNKYRWAGQLKFENKMEQNKRETALKFLINNIM